VGCPALCKNLLIEELQVSHEMTAFAGVKALLFLNINILQNNKSQTNSVEEWVSG